MVRRKRRWTTRRGSALPMSVFAAIILSVVGVGLLGLGIQGRIIAIRDAEQIQARCAADAGLTMAVYQMNSLLGAKEFSESSLPTAKDQSLPSSEATFSYTVAEDLETDDDVLEDFDDGTYEVMSVGIVGQTQKVVYATLRFKGLFDDAIVVKDRISLMPKTLV
jgi:hypothetical protein